MRKRSAERLDQLIEDKASEQGRLAPLVEVAKTLSQQSLVPPQPAADVEQGRRAFLAEAAELRQKRAGRRSYRSRLIASRREQAGWPAEQRVRGPQLAWAWRVAIVLVLLLGTASGTVVAAQHAGPTSLLYTVKLRSEEVRLALTADPRERADLVVALCERRVDEVAAITGAGQAVPEAVLVRLRELLEKALDEARLLPEAEMQQELEQFSATWQAHVQALEVGRAQSHDQARLSLDRAIALLMQADEYASLGLVDPGAFRQAGSAGLPWPAVGTPTPVPTTRSMPTATRTPEPTQTERPASPRAADTPRPSVPITRTPVPGSPTPPPQPTGRSGQTPGPERTAPYTQMPGPDQTPGPGQTPGSGQPPGSDQTPGPGQTPGSGQSPHPTTVPGPPNTPEPTHGRKP